MANRKQLRDRPGLRPRAYKLGQPVDVLDTANDNILQAYVRQVEGDKVQVYVERFENTMWFNEAGTTRLGRFHLKGRTKP